MKTIVIKCKPELLTTIHDNDQEFVEYFGLDYDLVNCIELI